MKTIKLSALVCALGLLAGTALAGPGFGPGKGMNRIFEELELTETQQQQLTALKEAHRTEMESNREANQAAREAHQTQMKALLTADPIDVEAVKALRAEGQTQRQQADEQRFEHKLAMLQILTPEQRETFLEHENRMDRKGKKGKHGGKKGCGGQKGE